eukprot:355265-Chlamydomonas_euryale.AAC.11
MHCAARIAVPIWQRSCMRIQSAQACADHLPRLCALGCETPAPLGYTWTTTPLAPHKTRGLLRQRYIQAILHRRGSTEFATVVSYIFAQVASDRCLTAGPSCPTSTMAEPGADDELLD